MNIQDVDSTLRAKYQLPHRLFGLQETDYGTNHWRIRRVIANILVGGSRERSALKAVGAIFDNFTFDDLTPPLTKGHSNRLYLLTTILEENDIKWPLKKAAYVIRTCGRLKEKFNGQVPSNRDDLETVWSLFVYFRTGISDRWSSVPRIHTSKR